MGSPLKEPKLLLNEFKTLHRVLSRGLPPWASFLLLGFLVWVEERFIQQRVDQQPLMKRLRSMKRFTYPKKWSSLRRSTRKQEVTSLMR
jgi:hypothetical protein